MSDVVNARLYAGLQKLKGFVKLCHDAEGKLKYVKTQAGEMAEAQKKIRSSFPTKPANVSKPKCHLTLVK